MKTVHEDSKSANKKQFAYRIFQGESNRQTAAPPVSLNKNQANVLANVFGNEFHGSGPGALSPSHQNVYQLHRTIGNRAVGRLMGEENRERAVHENSNGLPGNLKAGIESLSGVSMDDVEVTYNSTKPSRLDAYAYAQGTNIHVGPGRENFLAHEAWHVVQQKQGRVQPTMRTGGFNINNNASLEREADVMGAKSLQTTPWNTVSAPVQHAAQPQGQAPIQMMHPDNSPEKRKKLTKELGESVMKQIMDTELEGDAAKEREAMTRKFLKKGKRGDAYKFLKKYPQDNSLLEISYRFALTSQTGILDYDKSETEMEEVESLLGGLRDRNENDLLASRRIILEAIESNPDASIPMRPQLIAIDLALKKLFKTEMGKTEFFTLTKMPGGAEISVYGDITIFEANMDWIGKVLESLTKDSFLDSIQPPLNIKLIFHPRVSRDFASTDRSGGFINVNLEEYQVSKFTPGEMSGLIAHELGVHTLDRNLLSPQQLSDEAADAPSFKTGIHGGKEFKVGKTPGSERQQADHLTVGRGVLGQQSALPRLEMYEKTFLSFLDSQKGDLENQRETAAAYCIDIARFLVLNDDTQKLTDAGVIGKVKIAYSITSAALNEWERIKMKYADEYPVLNNIEITRFYLGKCLGKLSLLLSDVGDKPSYLKE